MEYSTSSTEDIITAKQPLLVDCVDDQPAYYFHIFEFDPWWTLACKDVTA